MLKRVQVLETEVAQLRKREEEQRLAFKRQEVQIQQIQEKFTNEIEHLKLYVDFMNKMNAIEQQIESNVQKIKKT